LLDDSGRRKRGGLVLHDKAACAGLATFFLADCSAEIRGCYVFATRPMRGCTILKNFV
jgi:hypothetical protein